MAKHRYGLTQTKKQIFLDAYGRIGVISAAARVANIDRVTHYNWMASDSKYAEAFALKEEEAKELLEEEAHRRAVAGVDKPLVYQGRIMTDRDGKPVTIKEYSDTMLIFLMKGAMPEKYRDRYEIGGLGGGPLRTASTVIVADGSEQQYVQALRRYGQQFALTDGAGAVMDAEFTDGPPDPSPPPQGKSQHKSRQFEQPGGKRSNHRPKKGKGRTHRA